jgi:hypothetical protein
MYSQFSLISHGINHCTPCKPYDYSFPEYTYRTLTVCVKRLVSLFEGERYVLLYSTTKICIWDYERARGSFVGAMSELRGEVKEYEGTYGNAMHGRPKTQNSKQNFGKKETMARGKGNNDIR